MSLLHLLLLGLVHDVFQQCLYLYVSLLHLLLGVFLFHNLMLLCICNLMVILNYLVQDLLLQFVILDQPILFQCLSCCSLLLECFYLDY